MTDLCLRKSWRGTDDKPIELFLREHGPAETSYTHICYVAWRMADDLVRGRHAFWLHGDPRENALKAGRDEP